MVSFICWWAICFDLTTAVFSTFLFICHLFLREIVHLSSTSILEWFQLVSTYRSLHLHVRTIFFFTYFTEIEWRVGKWKPVKGWLFTFMEMHLVHFIYNDNLKLDPILRKQLCSIFFSGFRQGWKQDDRWTRLTNDD